MQQQRPLLFVIGLLLASASLANVSADHDGDDIPDVVESNVCSRETPANTVNTVAIAGTCDKDTNDFRPSDLLTPPDVGDADGNGVPDSIDAVVCAVLPSLCADGAIVIPPEDVQPPSTEDSNNNGVPDSVEAGICAAVPTQCDADGNLIIPGVPPLPGDDNGNGIPDAIDDAVCSVAAEQLCEGGAIIVPEEVPDLGDGNGNGIPDAVDVAVCGTPLGATVCDENGAITAPDVPIGPPSLTDSDGDGVPDAAEGVLCPAAAALGFCTDSDFNPSNVTAIPLEPFLGPVCDAAGSNAPSEVCILRVFTVGQVVCLARGSAPGNGFAAYCQGGAIATSCAGSDPQAIVNQWMSDADCDGFTNEIEAFQGCDPTDPQSFPSGEGCASGDPGPDPVSLLSCGGSSEPTDIADQLISDADCDGFTNEIEIFQGCNPASAEDYPSGTGCSTSPVPPTPTVPPVPTP